MSDDSEPVRLSRRSFLATTTTAAAVVPALVERRAQAAGKLGGPDAVLGPDAVPLAFTLDGVKVRTVAEPRETLADVLLWRLDATAVKVACDRGACGACTVMLGAPGATPRTRNACMTPALDVEGQAVTTVAGVALAPGKLHPIQAAFCTHDALQCGYCTPGFVVSAAAFLARKAGAPATRDEVSAALSGNLCRCGSQPHVIDAVLAAAGSRG